MEAVRHGLPGLYGGMIGLFSICSCANQGAPSGGPQDLTGPQVVETFPDTFAVVEAFDDEIRIGFDERISESGVQGPLDDAVIISPESGEVRVRHSSRALGVTMVGGFQPDQVYRVTVQPFVQDLFRNVMVDAFEFIFSTGAEMTPTVLAGSIVDRITGQPVDGARVTAHIERPPGVERSDDELVPTHVAITDSSGVYAFRYVPSGRYEITAFMDQNRNGEPDGIEPIGTAEEELNPADTLFRDFSLLAPDTTPAMVGSAEVVDSLTLAAEFDDFLDPDSELVGVSASLGPDSLSPTGGSRDPARARLPGPTGRDSRFLARRRLDSIRRGTAANRVTSECRRFYCCGRDRSRVEDSTAPGREWRKGVADPRSPEAGALPSAGRHARPGSTVRVGPLGGDQHQWRSRRRGHCRSASGTHRS